MKIVPSKSSMQSNAALVLELQFGTKKARRKAEKLVPYDYTGKNIILINKEEAAIKSEIAQVKALPRNLLMWTSNPDGIDALYINDPVTKIKGVSDKKKKLLEEIGLKTVQDLVDLGADDVAFKSIVKKMNGVRPEIAARICE